MHTAAVRSHLLAPLGVLPLLAARGGGAAANLESVATTPTPMARIERPARRRIPSRGLPFRREAFGAMMGRHEPATRVLLPE
jgi:hypothetical protein